MRSRRNFADVPSNFTHHIRAVDTGTEPNSLDLESPTIKEGVAGMSFIQAIAAFHASTTAFSPQHEPPGG